MPRFLVVLAALSLAAAPASATIITYSLAASGDQETGPGDPNGSANGTITLDDATGEISWSFNYLNIAAPTGMHIHGPGGSAGNSVGVFESLGVATSGGAGTLISSKTTTPANVAQILADPTDFYVNIHNSEFSSGAIRGQLGSVVPEPTTLALLGAGLAGLALGGRRR